MNLIPLFCAGIVVLVAGCDRQQPKPQFLVVHNGVTNKFDSLEAAVSNAPVGATVYIPEGCWDIGAKGTP